MVVVAMRVLREGYWNEKYSRPDDVIDVDEELVLTLEQAGFAERVTQDDAPPETQWTRATKPRRTERT